LSAPTLVAGPLPVPPSPVEPPVLRAPAATEFCEPVPPVLLPEFSTPALPEGVAPVLPPLLPVDPPELNAATAKLGRRAAVLPVGLD
jgi:hypothetical protein